MCNMNIIARYQFLRVNYDFCNKTLIFQNLRFLFIEKSILRALGVHLCNMNIIAQYQLFRAYYDLGPLIVWTFIANITTISKSRISSKIIIPVLLIMLCSKIKVRIPLNYVATIQYCLVAMFLCWLLCQHIKVAI